MRKDFLVHFSQKIIGLRKYLFTGTNVPLFTLFPANPHYDKPASSIQNSEHKSQMACRQFVKDSAEPINSMCIYGYSHFGRVNGKNGPPTAASLLRYTPSLQNLL